MNGKRESARCPWGPAGAVTAAFGLLLSSCAAGPEVSSPARAGRLPPGAFDGSTRLGVRRTGRELELSAPEALSWDTVDDPGDSGTVSGEFSPVPGIKLRLGRRGPPEAPVSGWVEVEAEASSTDTELELELYPGRFQGPPIWGRLGAPRLPGVVLLARGRSGGRLHDAVRDPQTGWALRLEGSDESVRWSPEEDDAGRGGFRVRFRLAGEVPARLDWLYHPPAAGSPAPGRFSGAETSGWTVHPDSIDFAEASILEMGRELLRFTPADSLDVLELGRGWRERVEKRTANPDTGPFPDGLAPVVSTLAVQGYRVGLWIAPFGSDDRDERERSPQRFITAAADGRPVDVQLATGAPSTLDSHVYDPTSEAGRSAIRERVAATLREHGQAVRILRLGGLGELAAAYETYAQHLQGFRGAHGVASIARRREVARRAFHAALEAVRAAAGSDRLLAGDETTPAWAAGLLDACGPRFEPRDGGDLLRLQAAAALRDLRHHGLSWQGEGLGLDFGEDRGGLGSLAAWRAFLDLQALTGRSTRLRPESFLRLVRREEPELREEIEALRAALRRASPSGGRRALDLDLPERAEGAALPALWCVTGRGADGEVRDVLGVFNWNSFGPERVQVSLQDLGWSASERRRVLVFDLEAERVVGIVTGGQFDLLLPARSSRLLALLQFPTRPTVIADSLWKVSGERRGVDESWDAASGALDIARRASPRPPPGGRERLHLITPGPGWHLVDVRIRGGARPRESTGIHRVLELSRGAVSPSPLHARLTFRVESEAGAGPGESARGGVSARSHRGTGGVWIEWDGFVPQDRDEVRTHEVLVDGIAVGRTFDTRFLHVPEPPWKAGTSHSVSVVAVGESGERERLAGGVAYREPAAVDLALTELSPLRIDQSWGFPGKDRAVDGGPLATDPLATVSTRGAAAGSAGLGVAIPSRIEYDLRGRFARFSARAGIDRDADLWSRARFRVLLDGEELYASPLQRFGDRPLAVDLSVAGGRRLVLQVESPPGSDGRPIQAPLAFWRSAVLRASGE